MSLKSEDREEQHEEVMRAYGEYAVMEARDFELMFWEQVFLRLLDTGADIKTAASDADLACKERAKRL